LRDPLRIEFEQGHGGKSILRSFTTRELRALPIRLRGTKEGDENMRIRAAKDLLRWFDALTPRKIDHDIQRVLEGHEKMAEHMKPFDSFVRPGEKMWSCGHESECVQLDGYHGASNELFSMFMEPARGLDASNYVIEMGWEKVAFPRYLVVVEE
jgi:hypothetical protein